MKSTYIDGEHLGIADLVRMEKSFLGLDLENCWLLTRINIPKKYRGRGYASALLKRILADADKEAATLVLEISPSDGLQYEELSRWYYRYGFAQTEVGYWVRRPAELVCPYGHDRSYYSGGRCWNKSEHPTLQDVLLEPKK